MRLSLLGPLLVDGSPGSAVLGAAKERSLLATLALNPGAVVSTDSLIAAVWGDDPPATARKTLQTYIWNLRQSLGTEVIATEPPGYALRIAPGDVDVWRFRSLVRDGEAAMGAGDAARASVVLRDATALWRGEPFGAVAAHTGLAGEAVRLKEEYASAIETRVSADLAVSRHAELVGELEALVHDHPFRERLWGHLMVALYRCGRQADALATYKRARERLVEELGLEPGGELRRVEEAILNHDAALAAPHRLGAPLATACGAASGVLRSPVRYARSSDGVSIAYQVAGDGPVDILAIPGFVTHLDIWWNAPTDGLVRRLTSIGRLISFDKRGMGLSDRPESVDAMKWVDDALAVLDAAEAKEVVLLGVSAGTPTAIRVASLHRERVRALVVFGGGARTIAGPGYEIGHDRATVESFAANLERGWGSGVAISSFAPSRAKEPHVRDYWARYQQLSAAPAAAIRYFWAAAESDVTELLATISTPTLVLHPERDIVAPVTWGRFMADHIPGAKFATLDSDVHLICVSDVIDDMAREIDDFIRRDVLGPHMGGVEPALVTVLAVRVRDDHRSGVESVIERCGGRLQGPATTAIFDAPSCAARCASRVVDEVTADEVGVGIHTGECFHSNDGYRGGAVDVAHQLAAAAAPGEVLLTTTVSDLVADSGLCVEQRAIALPAHRGGIVALASSAAPSRS
jgi:DNA-binding SARP family transcriptional activator/pimeloyl-ACP methyl ester carboxylesterase